MLASLKHFADLDLLSVFSSQRQLLGLDIGSSSIKLVQMKEHRGRYTLQKFAVKELEPEVIVDGTVMDEGRVVTAIKELLTENNIKLKQVAISISGHAVIIKKISLPPMPDEELDSQVRLAAEQYIPFDINEVNLDFYVLPPSENPEEQGEMSIVLVAAKKDKINELTELVKAAGLLPVVMDVDAFAIENMYGATAPGSDEDIATLVNIGASVMNVNIVKGGVSLFTRDIPLGGNRYSEAVQRELGVSFEEAEQLKRGEPESGDPLSAVMESVNAEVASEIARTIDYFKTTSSDGEITRVLLCGGGAKIKGLSQQLRDRMHVEVEIANPFSEVDISQCQVDQDFLAEMGPIAAVGVGLALRTVGDR
ncbi:type IV pilus assembly protein PilM [Nitrospirales bacterium NOB]|nr:MAG: type IV pilus biogenesis protein PilM [Nitrospira sp. OLB3]MBV6469643.1 Cell division protein FtsA [Nitrospirota bacterium]MCE7965515.1 type IV pilus assembly protein PilM [Nitrospira sp. NTP2]MCK6493458.1 pilus assembly protein PilM [Nitrospira sp.]MDL1888248.1 type IV pilus assembly protein PilM [Nitrospirales bacterium NOB]MEB2338762.1 type IV pilus assembly protein PilM [Nitrospirales bacterium]